MFFGAIIQTIKGVKDNFQLKEKNKELENEIQDLSSLGKLLSTIEDDFDRIIALNQFIYADYLYKREIFKNYPNYVQELWAKVIIRMNKNIEKVEQQLKSKIATKLDIARIITTLTQISGEVDKELLVLKDTLAKNEGALRLSKQQIGAAKEALSKELQKHIIDSVQTLRSGIAKEMHVTFHRELGKVALSLKQNFQEQINDLREKHHKKFEETDEHIKSIEQYFEHEMGKIHQKLEIQEYIIHSLGAELKTRIQELQAQYESRLEEHKKMVFKLTIPLYTISFITLISIIYMLYRNTL